MERLSRFPETGENGGITSFLVDGRTTHFAIEFLHA
jgi:hypothetical protein